MLERIEPYVGEEPYIFVSYAHKDMEEVMNVISKLYQKRYRIWYDDGIPLMDDYPRYLRDRIFKCDVFMIFLSKASMDSVNVQQEIYRAFMSKKKILAILLEDIPLRPGFRLILGVTQYINKVKFLVERDFFDKLYENEKLKRTQKEWYAQNFFKLDEKIEEQKRKLSSLKYSENFISSPCTNEYYGLDIQFHSISLGGFVGYSIGFDQRLQGKNGSTVYYLKNTLPVLQAVGAYGYPDVSKEDLQVFTDEEAEIATQLAVWSLAIANDELEKDHRILDLDNLRPKSTYYAYMDRIKNAARKIMKCAIDKPIYSNPRLYIDPRDTKLVVSTTHMLAGPYKVVATGFKVSAINVSVDNYSASIVDSRGVIKKKVESRDNIYVRLNKYEVINKTRIYVYAIGTISEGRIYGSGDPKDENTNYFVNVNFPVILEDSVKVKWSKLTGNIKILVIDQYKNKVSGAIFELVNADNRCVATSVSDKEGNIEFNDISIGKYQLLMKDFSEEYVVAKDGFSFEVTLGNTKKVTYQLKKRVSCLQINVNNLVVV